MAVAAAGHIRSHEAASYAESGAFAVPELERDAEIRQQAATFIGAVAIDGWEPDAGRETAAARSSLRNLHEAIRAAATGDQTAYKMVETNVTTDVVERTIKAGHVTEVELMADVSGKLYQYNQTLESVQANSLRFASGRRQMRGRVEAETRNAFRLQDCYDSGLLEEYCFVVFSRAADDMSPEEMKKAGFFTDTMGTAIQLTTVRDGHIVMESAFVAGKATQDAHRHDKATIKGVGARLGVDIGARTATELLDFPLLVPKSRLPDGVVDLVRIYDESAGGTFFGEDRPVQDYRTYRDYCRQREAGFQPKIREIVADLLAEAGSIASPVMATRRLNVLSGRHMIELAAWDTSIDARVFGDEAAGYIREARWQLRQGNYDQAWHQIREAEKHDKSSSCPGGSDEDEEGGSGNGGSRRTSKESDDCDFISKECPLCHRKNVRTLSKIVGKKRVVSGSCGCKKSYSA